MHEYFNPNATEYALGMLETATVQAVLLVGLAFLGSACVRRAATRATLWTATIVGLAVMPVLSLTLPHCFLGYDSVVEPLHFPSHMARPLRADFGVCHWLRLSDETWSDRAGNALLGIWAAGVAVSLGRLGWSWVRVARLLRRAQPCHDPRVQRIVRSVVRTHDEVTVLEMQGLVGAICWQIHRPKIILPADAHRLTDVELEMMIRHEWAHLRRNDPSALFLQRLVEAFYWFHPLVWVATIQVSKYREFACDDAVVRAGFRANEYAECLGQLAFWNYAPFPSAPAGLGMLWNQHLVLLRVKRLVRGKYTLSELNLRRALTFQCAAGLVIFSCSVLRVDCSAASLRGSATWTAWPQWTAGALDMLGIEVRDFPLDAHRYDPSERERLPSL